MLRTIAILALLMLAGCNNGPTEEDMRGCYTGSERITARDVADCAVKRAERQK